MPGPGWKPLRRDPESGLALLSEAASEARTAGDRQESEGWESQREAVRDGKLPGTLAYGSDGRAWGMAVWTALGARGRRVSPIYLTKARQNPTGWTEFLTALLEQEDPDGPVLLLNAPMTGFAESDALELLAPRGFHPFHRYAMVFPPGTALPADATRSLEGGRVRTVRKKDLDSLAQLTATCYANSAERFLFGAEFEALAAARTLLTTLLDGQFGPFMPEASFALEIDGQIMGATLVTHRPTHNLLADVEVHPTLQGQGHARRLIRATLQALSGDPTTPLGLSVTQEAPGVPAVSEPRLRGPSRAVRLLGEHLGLGSPGADTSHPQVRSLTEIPRRSG